MRCCDHVDAGPLTCLQGGTNGERTAPQNLHRAPDKKTAAQRKTTVQVQLNDVFLNGIPLFPNQKTGVHIVPDFLPVFSLHPILPFADRFAHIRQPVTTPDFLGDHHQINKMRVRQPHLPFSDAQGYAHRATGRIRAQIKIQPTMPGIGMQRFDIDRLIGTLGPGKAKPTILPARTPIQLFDGFVFPEGIFINGFPGSLNMGFDLPGSNRLAEINFNPKIPVGLRFGFLQHTADPRKIEVFNGLLKHHGADDHFTGIETAWMVCACRAGQKKEETKTSGRFCILYHALVLIFIRPGNHA